MQLQRRLPWFSLNCHHRRASRTQFPTISDTRVSQLAIAPSPESLEPDKLHRAQPAITSQLPLNGFSSQWSLPQAGVHVSLPQGERLREVGKVDPGREEAKGRRSRKVLRWKPPTPPHLCPPRRLRKGGWSFNHPLGSRQEGG